MESFRILVLALVAVSPLMVTGNRCPVDTTARYKVTFTGLWDKESFPKVYPTLRPKAEWSSLLGKSHSDTYSLFSEGEEASEALRLFAESAITRLLDGEGQGHLKILDGFTAPPLAAGTGTTTAAFYADRDHSLLSMIAKIVPSPDWFVGVDSMALCRGGNWRDIITADLRPMDAGTQKGYTFSSPKWRSDPAEGVFQITNMYPNNSADAFYYPNQAELPPIAHVQVELMQILQGIPASRESHDVIRSMVLMTQLDAISALRTSRRPIRQSIRPPVPRLIKTSTGVYMRAPYNRITAIPQKPPSASVLATTAPTAPPSITTAATTPTSTPTTTATTTPITTTTTTRKPSTTLAATTTTSPPITIDEEAQDIIWVQGVTGVPGEQEKATPDDKEQGSGVEGVLIDTHTTQSHDDDNGMETGSGATIQTARPTERTRESLRPNYEQTNKILPADADDRDQLTNADDDYTRECLVTEWSEWSTCSRTCGYGYKTRSREIVRWTNNIVCPQLTMEQLCGSMSNCNWQHFSLNFNSTGTLNNTVGGRGNSRRRRLKKPGLQLEDGSRNAGGAPLRGRQQSRVVRRGQLQNRLDN